MRAHPVVNSIWVLHARTAWTEPQASASRRSVVRAVLAKLAAYHRAERQAVKQCRLMWRRALGNVARCLPTARGSDDAMLDREGDGLSAARHPQLSQDVADVTLHGRLADR